MHVHLLMYCTLINSGWEAFGEDPYLQGVAGSLTVKGIQSQGVVSVTNMSHMLIDFIILNHFIMLDCYWKTLYPE